MDEPRARIVEDLRGVLHGDLLFEPHQRAAYAHDASWFEIDPLGVVVPRTEEDLVAVVRYAAEHQIPLHARGAGTGLAGESLGPGLVLDFSRYLRRIIAVGPDSVVVQPGVTREALAAHLAPLGRRLAADPDGSGVSTIGGMIGRNEAGLRALRHGAVADHVERLRVIFAHGETAELGCEPRAEDFDEPTEFKRRLVHKVEASLARRAEAIARWLPRTPRNRCGYTLDGVLTPHAIHLPRLLCGAEGTLALITEATLRTVPIPHAQAVIVVPFRRVGEAASAVLDCLADGPSACILLDRRVISLLRESIPEYREALGESAEAVLVIEFEGDETEEVERRARRLVGRLGRHPGVVSPPWQTSKRSECERLLGLRRAVLPRLLRMGRPARPIPLLESLSVPLDALPGFLHRLQNIFKQHEVNATWYAHAGLGQVHARPFLDLGNPRDVAQLEPLAAEVHDAVFELGGTISGEHGYGLARTQFLRRQYGELVHLFWELKTAFDPQGLLNPGKIVGDDPYLMTRHLKPMPVSREGLHPADGSASLPDSTVPSVSDATSAPAGKGGLPIWEGALRWGDGGIAAEASLCNGCGACRSAEPTLRMCPTFRASHAEAATPRAKANLLRQMAAGALDPRLWGSEELKQNADLCIHCQLCPMECPAGVDVSSLMIEAKAAYVEAHGLSPSDWLLSRVELWSRLASRFPVLFNAMLANRPARWVLERLLGLSRHRRLPRAHRTPFTRRAERRGLTQARPHLPGPRVAYFLDIFANYFDQELAEVVVGLLQHAGVNVFVPTGQRGSGMAALVAGDLEAARAAALANLRILGDAVRDGFTIVCSEPTAALMLRREYLKLTDDLDAALVAEHTRDVGDYLAGLVERGHLDRPSQALRVRVGYHQPCHLRALEVGTPGLELIRQIPGLDVEFIDRGCSGMAGTFGLARRNFRTSLRAGRGLLSRLREPDLEVGATECAACRLQMEQGAPKRTLHPMKLLSLAYGLEPNLRRHLVEPRPRHAIS